MPLAPTKGLRCIKVGHVSLDGISAYASKQHVPSLALPLAIIAVTSRAGGKRDPLYFDDAFGRFDAVVLDYAERAPCGTIIDVTTQLRGGACPIDRIEGRSHAAIIEHLKGLTVAAFMADEVQTARCERRW